MKNDRIFLFRSSDSYIPFILLKQWCRHVRGVKVSHKHICPHTHAQPKTAQFYSINQCHFPFLGSCSPVPYSIILLARSGFLPLMGKSIATLNRFHNQFFYHRSTKLLPGFKNRNTFKKRKGKKQQNV